MSLSERGLKIEGRIRSMNDVQKKKAEFTCDQRTRDVGSHASILREKTYFSPYTISALFSS